MKGSTIVSKSFPLLSGIILIFTWKLVSMIVGAEIIFPSPEATFVSLQSILAKPEVLLIILSTIIRVLIAFVISCTAGIIVGLATGLSKHADSFIRPILVTVMSAPVISFILLALIWFRADQIPIFVGFLIIFPIITINVSEGIKNVDRNLIDMATGFRVGKNRILKEIYLPSIMSHLVAGISTAVGIGWKVVVTAEVLSQPQFAIGTSMETAKAYLDTSTVFAWTIITVVLSYTFEKAVSAFESRIFFWR